MTAIPGRKDHRDARERQGARPPVSFIAWGAVSGRSREIAEALGGEAHCLFPPEASWRPHPAVRYVLCTFDTVAYVLRRRPRSLVVTNPPVVAGLVTLACGRLIGSPVVIDSHPGAFGAQGDTMSARLQKIHRWLVRHADGSIVASEPWVDQVRAWGGAAVELHEAPGFDAPARAATVTGTLQLLCVGRLAPDEPFEEIVKAARQVPDVSFLVTGDVERVPWLREHAPPNVTFTGFLPKDEYERALVDADAVMTLTTEPSSVMRAAYEAVYARRPLVVTNWPLGLALFPYAVHVGNDADAIAQGVRRLRDDFRALARQVDAARDVQLTRWSTQIPQLRRMLQLADHVGEGSSEGSKLPRS
jgi:glycosyltransferase involved in cell wall biosynthesis